MHGSLPIRDQTDARDAAVQATALVCREIREQDLDAIVDCLALGFPERPASYWRRALLRLRDRSVPDGYPRYGYTLTDNGLPVGVVLLIVATADDGNVRANVSSWFVEPAYRSYSSVLLAAAFRAKDVTFLNISPDPSTIATIEAQGYTRYVDGTFHAIAALGPSVAGARLRSIEAADADASPLLAEHAACGCICLEVSHEGTAYPFVFVASRFLAARLPAAQLVYCPSIADFVRFAGPLGRRLAKLGLPVVLVDATAPIPGLVGLYAAGRRVKYFRGPDRPRLGDLSRTELVYFGP